MDARLVELLTEVAVIAAVWLTRKFVPLLLARLGGRLTARP